MSELREFLENQKERWTIVKDTDGKDNPACMKLCDESIADIDRYLEKHKPIKIGHRPKMRTK